MMGQHCICLVKSACSCTYTVHNHAMETGVGHFGPMGHILSVVETRNKQNHIIGLNFNTVMIK